MSFRSAKSRLKIEKVGGLERPMGATAVFSERVGGRGGGQQRLLESDKNWQESPRKGGGGFRASAARRRPPGQRGKKAKHSKGVRE